MSGVREAINFTNNVYMARALLAVRLEEARLRFCALPRKCGDSLSTEVHVFEMPYSEYIPQVNTDLEGVCC
jgi:hypothetical protein